MPLSTSPALFFFDSGTGTGCPSSQVEMASPRLRGTVVGCSCVNPSPSALMKKLSRCLGARFSSHPDACLASHSFPSIGHSLPCAHSTVRLLIHLFVMNLHSSPSPGSIQTDCVLPQNGANASFCLFSHPFLFPQREPPATRARLYSWPATLGRLVSEGWRT